MTLFDVCMSGSKAERASAVSSPTLYNCLILAHRMPRISCSMTCSYLHIDLTQHVRRFSCAELTSKSVVVYNGS